jgi:uncharacterized membrane protein
MSRKRLHRLSALWWIAALLSIQHVRIAFADDPIVHAVLFYSPTCGHCHYVITEVLPPLFEQYGDQLQMVTVDTTTADGQALYQAAIDYFGIRDELQGVPTLILDDYVLVGSARIPEQLPGLIEQYLAEGGVGWPAIPGLAAVLPASEALAEAVPEPPPDQIAAAAPAAIPDAPSVPGADAAPQNHLFSLNDVMSKLQRDPAGNTLSILLLIGMLGIVGRVLWRMRRTWKEKAKIIVLTNHLKGWRSVAVALLCLIGLGVSIYMAYVETTHTAAVCGPIGDCNTVQQSPYALLLGILPVGVLGVLGYAAMLIVWVVIQRGQGKFRNLSESTLLGMALLGTLFSIYLTFLEPFVIGATCVWCLTSAISMSLTLLVLAGSISAPVEPLIEAIGA